MQSDAKEFVPKKKTKQAQRKRKADILFGQEEKDNSDKVAKKKKDEKTKKRKLVLIDTGSSFSRTNPSALYRKLGCVVRMVVDSILLHAESGPNDHRKDAPLFRIMIDHLK